MSEIKWIKDEELIDLLDKYHSNELAGNFSCVLSEILPSDFPANLDAVNDLFKENGLGLRVTAVRDADDDFFEWQIQL